MDKDKTLADKGIKADVLHVHGMLQKYRKFDIINIFCKKTIVPDYDPRAIVATAAADLGISHPLYNKVNNNKRTDNAAYIVQRKGQGSRNGEDSTTMCIAGVSAYLAMIMRMF